MRHFDPEVTLSKIQFQIGVMEFIYAKSNHQIQAKVNQMVDLHCIRYPGESQAFQYKGEVYWRKPQATVIRGKRVKLLHQEQYPDMDSCLRERALIEAEQPIVRTFISCAASKAWTKDQLYLLLPECLHSVIQQTEYPNLKPHGELSAEEGMAFQEANSKVIQLIKQRLILNLIT